MDTEQTCPACQRPLPANAPQGLCPECLMKGGLGSRVEIGTATTASDPGGSGDKPFVPPTVAEIARFFPQLEVLAFIGQGGMGAVYKARQKQLDRVVALKILPPGIGDDAAFAKRFAREAKAMAKLSHPGIVTIHDFGQTDGLFYFLMEFVDGVTLWQLQNTGQVSPREALAIVPQICDALQYAHDAGIVHRDIKPENILLDRQGGVKVADFGLAKLVGIGAEPVAEGGAPAAAPALTEAGRAMGTPQYMAPEQRERPQEVDHRADIYSLGVVFYQLLTGELPSCPIEPPSKRVQIDVPLDEVVLRALEKEPQRRYQQASVLKTQVETIASTAPVQPPRERQSESPASGRSLPILAGILFLLPPAVFIWFLLAGHRTLGVDLDADVQFFTGLLGLPLSAGVGAVLAWVIEMLRSSLGLASDEVAPGTPRRWCWQAILSVVLLVVSLPLGGGAIVLLVLMRLESGGWDPGTEELVVTLSLFGGTFLTAAAATLLGIEALRRIRRASEPLRGRFGALAAAWFWPCMLAALAITLPSWERDRQRRAEHAERQARMAVDRIRTHLKLADQQDLERLVEAIASGDLSPIRGLAIRIAEHEGEKSIPLLIGVMDADNSFETLYSVGYFGLRRLTGVEFSSFHDGAWWRRWWEANRQRFPEEVRTIPIPVFEKTENGRKHTPFPEDIDTLQGKLRLAAEVLDVYRRRLPDEGDRFPPGRVGLWLFAQDVAKHEDPHAIPYLIGLVAVDKYAVGHFGLSKITGVKYSDRHDAAWWRQWWQENKSTYSADVQAIEIPDYQTPLTFSWKEPTVEEKKQPSTPRANPAAELELKNGSMEEGDAAPFGWEKGAAVPGVEYVWDRAVGHDSQASLCLHKTAQRYFPIAQWYQTVAREGDSPAIQVSAQVKAEEVTKAILDVIFLDDNGEWISHEWASYIGAKDADDAPVSHDWTEYSGRVNIPAGTREIQIALQIYGPGKVWFDEVLAQYTQ